MIGKQHRPSLLYQTWSPSITALNSVPIRFTYCILNCYHTSFRAF